MTTHAEYAAEYASGVHSDPPTVAQPGEEFVVIAAWACPGLIYPITRDHAGIDCDYAPGEAFSMQACKMSGWGLCCIGGSVPWM